MKYFAWLIGFLLFAGVAHAQPMQVVTKCGQQTLHAGDGVNGFVDVNGNTCTNTGGGAGAATFTVNNKGGTVSLGGTAQTLMAANPNRVGCSFQPQSGDLWFTTIAAGSAAAVQPSFFLPAPSLYTCPPGFRGAISIFGATTGQTFAAEEDTVP